MRQGKLTLRWHGDRSYTSDVLYEKQYILQLLGRFFEVLEYHHEYPIYQDMVILRPRACAP